ncbi:MAG: hypothetical protein IKJ34_08530 [Mailhella sp.]|nr:hypothetical protein [Mailhella sp.]
MPVSRETLLDKLHDAYTVYFDEVTVPDDVQHLAASFAFYCNNECFVLSRKVKLWSAETNEFVYVFSLPELDVQTFEACRDKALELGMKHIRPHIDHRSSNITAVFVCDSIREDAVKAVEKTRIHKDFLFSLHGWMDFRAAAIDLSSGSIAVNRAAKELEEFIHGNLAKC